MINEKLKELAEKLRTAEDNVAKADNDLKDAKKNLELVSQTVVPDALENFGLAEFTTESGENIVVDDIIRGGPKVADRTEALKWLDDKGYGDLIKTHVIVSFDRTELEAAKTLLAKLQTSYPTSKLETKVEPPTMLSWIKDRLEDGTEFPLQLFNVQQFRKAKIKKAKKKRS